MKENLVCLVLTFSSWLCVTDSYCPLEGVTSTDPDLYPCLTVSRDQLSWLDALHVCEINGGTLAKIESMKQQDYIKSNQRNKEYTWFGMNDLAAEGDFVWTDGNNVTWFNWEHNQPNGGDEQNCTSINEKYEWEDKECEELYYYVCEITSDNEPVNNVYDPTSPQIVDKEATLKTPDSSRDIELLSLLKVEDELVCVLHCLYNPDCVVLGYGPFKTQPNCLLYKSSPGGFAPLFRGWNVYRITG
ncbi:macrophage mannose receptor 1-like [Haliotis rubra]|uniref:macrophage mannose receptor 1-like n=1 Tax=Haliotis rubra TaxID=36100 RepID=UPI001EE5F1E8|nr:macrophage mannose receptor 1-like [Haliotis rubra]